MIKFLIKLLKGIKGIFSYLNQPDEFWEIYTKNGILLSRYGIEFSGIWPTTKTIVHKIKLK